MHCRTRFEIIWTKELAEADTASHAADSILSSPDVRGIESLRSTRAIGQIVAMEEVNTDQIVERDGGASCQLDVDQLQPMVLSLNQNATNIIDDKQCCRRYWWFEERCWTSS